jgi:Tol biopolymer transport system component
MTMKQHKLFPIILLLALLAGCAAPTHLPPNSTSVSPTDTSTPTEPQIPAKATSTPTTTCHSDARDPEGCYILPTETLIPTATPYPPLSTNGPYFAYLRKTEKQATIIFLDSNGIGRNEILLPDDISRQMYDVNNLSPDGKWLAYYTGVPDNFKYPYDFPPQGPYDLALTLLNLETKESKLVTPLLSKDFPDNFQQQVDIFTSTEMPGELQIPDENIALELYRSFLNGINTVAWSPDGRYLAFAGQMNGLSSDLYVYDMETQKIRQLSSGSEEIQWISWSPDGKGILHGSTYVVGMGMECRIYIADLDGKSVRYLSEGMICNPPRDWLDDNTYFENENENGTGDFHLRSVNTQTGRITMYWEGSFGTYAIDAQKGYILLNALADTYPNPTSDFEEGLFLIEINTRRKARVLDGYDWYHQYFGLGERIFIALAFDEGKPNYFLKKDSTLMLMENDYDIVLVAPDQQHWVGINDKAFVFSADDTLIREINFRKTSRDTSRVEFVTWSPDSSGFYFQFQRSDHPLYFVSLLSGDPILIDKDAFFPYGEFPAFKWILAQP